MTERTGSATSPQREPRQVPAAGGEIRRVLVAIAEANRAADAIVDTAGAIAGAHGAELEVVSVVNPASSGARFPALENPVMEAPALRAEQRRRQTALRKYLVKHTGYAGGWHIDVPLGTVRDAIVGRARRTGADLIIMGLGHHGALEGLVHHDTARRVVRRASVPVLAVTEGLHGMPRTVMVATDFSRASDDVAHNACTLFRGCEKIVLAYVESEFDATVAEHDETARAIRTEGVAGAFQWLRERLDVAPGTSVESVTLRGTVAPQLTDLAQRCSAEVLAIAGQQHSMADRVMLGSVTAALLRRAPCSMLIRPIGSISAQAERK